MIVSFYKVQVSILQSPIPIFWIHGLFKHFFFQLVCCSYTLPTHIKTCYVLLLYSAYTYTHMLCVVAVCYLHISTLPTHIINTCCVVDCTYV